MPGYHKTDMSTLKVFQLAFLLILAGTTRLGSLAASDHTVLIIGEVNETSPVEEMAFAKIASLLTEIPHKKESTTEPTKISTDALASLGCGKVLSEFIGMLLTTAIAIALANSWKRKHTGFTAEADCTSVPSDTELEVQQEIEEPPQELPSQAELDWVDAARAGAMRLTDDVYCAAMEWWLDYPLESTSKSMGSRDQKLFKPVSELMRQGRTEEGCNLMEQIGRLDRVERELLRKTSSSLGSQPAQAAVSSSRSPLARSAPDLAVSAALMRNRAESDPSLAPRLTYRQATLFDAAPPMQAPVFAARSAPVLVRSSAEAKEPVAFNFNECNHMPAYACGA